MKITGKDGSVIEGPPSNGKVMVGDRINHIVLDYCVGCPHQKQGGCDTSDCELTVVKNKSGNVPDNDDKVSK